MAINLLARRRPTMLWRKQTEKREKIQNGLVAFIHDAKVEWVDMDKKVMDEAAFLF